MNGGVTVSDMEKRKAAVTEVERLRAQVRQLRQALQVAINTVECASIDRDGSELPWYVGAKNALRDSAEGASRP